MQASTNAEKALSINPSFGRVFRVKGHLALDMDDISAAIELVSKAIELEPYYLWNYRDRANLYFIASEYEKCIEDANHSPDTDGFTYLLRGQCNYYLGNYWVAENNLNEVFTIASDDAFLLSAAHFYIGEIRLYHDEDYEAAISEFNQSLVAGTDEITWWIAYYERAYAYDLLGNFHKAYYDYVEFLNFDLSDTSSTRDACNRINAIYYWDRSLGAGCNRFPNNSSGSMEIDETGNCPYGIIDGRCATMTDIQWIFHVQNQQR